jgi:hypothetical protein
MVGFQGVFIYMKEMIKKSVKAPYKRVSLFQFILLVFVAMIGLRLGYAMTLLGGQAHGDYPQSLDRSGEDVADEQAVLQWMKESSHMPEKVLEKVYNAAELTGNRDLILAICLVESNFNPHVESDKGAIGLMGIMPGVWLEELREKGIIREKEDLYKIQNNIAAGAYVLATYLSETNDLRQALIRYVGGASWYASKVLQAQRKIELARYSEQQLALSVGLN